MRNLTRFRNDRKFATNMRHKLSASGEKSTFLRDSEFQRYLNYDNIQLQLESSTKSLQKLVKDNNVEVVGLNDINQRKGDCLFQHVRADFGIAKEKLKEMLVDNTVDDVEYVKQCILLGKFDTQHKLNYIQQEMEDRVDSVIKRKRDHDFNVLVLAQAREEKLAKQSVPQPKAQACSRYTSAKQYKTDNQLNIDAVKIQTRPSSASVTAQQNSRLMNCQSSLYNCLKRSTK